MATKMMKYQDYELEAYFGEFAEEYRQKAAEMFESHDWETLDSMMDDDIREELHENLGQCDSEKFLTWYLAKHSEKHGCDFDITGIKSEKNITKS